MHLILAMSLMLVVGGSHFMHDGYCLLFYEATLNDSFLADLDELSDNEDDLLDADNDNAEHMEEDIVDLARYRST
ncbi:UNVERIFIED_CONTAM: hypothetical protein Sradi_2951200 [Sesamum radiatum]|uniref:Uncharacterized protein n=1 Tax=Sesamum radiatum TaxID=300843 RepID=A0AAW2RZM7_SESRA